ncbi:MAG: SMC-Scp complex subunit ScpB [bacterium]|nr:SMC-Scp complex subunit ScpB [bacterium]
MEVETQSRTSTNIVELASQAEAFLFTEGEPMARARLKKLLSCTDEDLASALLSLSRRQEGGGVTLVLTDREVALAVAPSCAPAIRAENEKEHEREIGDAGLEVLAILLYRGPSTRSQIDYIRGVNTSTTLRTLLARGLALRAENPNDSREYLYRPTAELLAHLGASRIGDLPDYEKITGELAAFETTRTNSDAQL